MLHDGVQQFMQSGNRLPVSLLDSLNLTLPQVSAGWASAVDVHIPRDVSCSAVTNLQFQARASSLARQVKLSNRNNTLFLWNPLDMLQYRLPQILS